MYTRGRLIDVERGRKVFGYSCGHTLCETNVNREQKFIDPFPEEFPIVPTVFMGRFIDVDSHGRKVFGILSECHQAPIEAGDVSFLLKDDWCPPIGVSNVIRLKFLFGVFPITASCFDPPDPCPEALLFNTGGRHWVGAFPMANGSSLHVDLELTTTQDPDRPLIDGYGVVYKWQVTFSGCQTPDRVVTAHVSCYYPLLGGGQFGGTLDVDCCLNQDSPDLGFKIEGFTNRRYLGRLIDVEGGKQKYGIADCCTPDPDCEIAHCCGCLVSPFQWEFDITGVINGPGPPFAGTQCPCHNGHWTLTLNAVDTGTEVCTWESEPYVDPACIGHVPTHMWHLTCNPGTGFVTLATQNTAGGGGTASYSIALASWNCLGPNTLTLTLSPAICLGWPATVTITPV